jgi:hypothetical protein
MDLVSALLAVAGGFAAGAFSGVIRRRARPAGSAPMCACKHGVNFHDPETGLCHAVSDGATLEVWEKGRHLGDAPQRIACTCRRYVGPELLADVWAPPLPTSPDRPS